MFPVQCEKIKNQPSNSTSCSDNALRLLVLVADKLYLRISSDVFIFNMGLRYEGLFWARGIYWRAKSHLKGIEDFNLEHCPYPMAACNFQLIRMQACHFFMNIPHIQYPMGMSWAHLQLSGRGLRVVLLYVRGKPTASSLSTDGFPLMAGPNFQPSDGNPAVISILRQLADGPENVPEM